MPRLPVVAVLALLAGAASAAEPLRIGKVQFEACDVQPVRGQRYRAQCATFPVPENHAEPGGRTIKLRAVLIEAESRRPLPDPVLMLAGGPGQSAVDAWPVVRTALAPLTRRRHVLLVDQRGTGQSNPLHCPLPDWKDELDVSVEAAREQARDCLRRVAPRADPRHYATADYIRDLEAVRQALGIETLNVMGGSYGTRVALEYLRRHPDAIRSVFIDSVVPPGLALLQDHAVNLDAAVQALVERCASDTGCRHQFGDVRAGLDALLRDVRSNPRTVTIPDPSSNLPLDVPFTEGALLWVVRFFSYSPEAASLLPLLLQEAAAGRPQALLAQAEMLVRSLPDELAHGMELSVICAEDADLLKVRDGDRSTLMGVQAIEYIQAQCEVWPHGERAPDFKAPVVSGKPVLLLSGQYDPVTPPRYADEVARTLSNSRHLVAAGQGHTPMTVGCMPRLLQRFVETLDPKGLDASCLEVLGDTPFFIGYQGPAP